MSPHSSPASADKNPKFISLGEAVTLVTYSRDYIGRLAREGKISSKQINKQWFVDRYTLLHFFEYSALEDSVKKRILSLNRKNDLEVRDFYQTKVAAIDAKSPYFHTASLLCTVVIVACGLFSGALIQASSQVSAVRGAVTFSKVIKNLSTASIEFSAQPAAVAAATLFSESQVIETQEKIPMDGGLIVFPAGTAKEQIKTAAELFSDEVVVVLTSTTTGFVKMSSSEKSLPFVRVPKESKP